MKPKMDCPPHCQNRQVGCQGKCERYKAFRAAVKADGNLRWEKDGGKMLAGAYAAKTMRNIRQKLCRGQFGKKGY